MAEATENKEAGATASGTAKAKTETATTDAKKVRRLNIETEEYVVGADGAKNEDLKPFTNLFYARQEATKQAKGAKKTTKIWVRDLKSQKKVEVVGTYEPS